MKNPFQYKIEFENEIESDMYLLIMKLLVYYDKNDIDYRLEDLYLEDAEIAGAINDKKSYDPKIPKMIKTSLGRVTFSKVGSFDGHLKEFKKKLIDIFKLFGVNVKTMYINGGYYATDEKSWYEIPD